MSCYRIQLLCFLLYSKLCLILLESHAIMLPNCANFLQNLFRTVIIKIQQDMVHKNFLTIHHYNNNIQYTITIIAYGPIGYIQ